jgi:glucokinase
MINKGAGVVAIDCGATNLKAAVVNRQGVLLQRQRKPTEAHLGMSLVVKNLAGLVKELSHGYDITAVTLGIAGVVNAHGGIITQAPNFPDGINFPIREELRHALHPLDLPILVENDANAYALGEMWLGAGKGFNSFICLTIGTGLGGGIILNRELWRGEDGTAAEIGHMVIYPDGERCFCGNQGCLEAYVSAVALDRIVRKGFEQKIETNLWKMADSKPEKVTPELLYQTALQGDYFSRGIWMEFGRLLGIGLSNLINIFNPEAIIIGGGIAQAWSLFFPRAKEEVKRRALHLPSQRVKLLQAKLGDEAAILGAASLTLTAGI